MDHFQSIYSHQPGAYHRMISAEDMQSNLIQALQAITPLAGKRILDVGSGTGRIPLLVASSAAALIGLDLHRPMLLHNRLERQRSGGEWQLVQGDLRHLPAPNGWAQVAIAGWAIGHLRVWFSQDWQAQIGMGLNEMLRVTAPGGWIIILETLGTGSLEPRPPSAELAEYYAWLETDWGFQRRAIQTDYHFDSVAEAVAATEFFFGAQLSDLIRQNAWTRLPEWTGVWFRQAG